MDKQNADKIITEYLQKIYGFAVKKSFSYDEAEELCAEIASEVYISLLRAKEIVNLEGYIWRISEHTYARYVSSKKRNEGISIDGMIIPYYEDFLPDGADDEIKALRREIAFLTEKRRESVYLFYYRGKSVSYISKKLSLPEGTVKWHLNKARNELKEGLSMERKIGKLGLSPISANGFAHSGNPGGNGGPEYYLKDKLNLNIVYSVYHSPKTKEEIAEELGVTPVYIEDKINLLEDNGFLVKKSGKRFTTFVKFSPETHSLEFEDKRFKTQFEIAKMLTCEYVASVREAISDIDGVYIPSGNREVLEAAAIFYGVSNKCRISSGKDISDYFIKTTDGGNYIAYVKLRSEPSDPEYTPVFDHSAYWACGDMNRWSEKYPSVRSWSIDSRFSSREGTWQNNLTSDYEYLYEIMNGTICDNAANAEKFGRLRERRFLTEDGKINITIVKGNMYDFFNKIPSLSESLKEKYASAILEYATAEAKQYPPQMQDLVINHGIECFIGRETALMVMDILYENGTFTPLTENEKVTSNLIMFSDILP